VKTIPVLLALVPLGLAACGGSSPTATTGVSHAAQTAARNYQAAGTDMSGVIAQYRTDTTTMLDVSSCQAIEAAYQAKMAPLVDRMSTTSVAMDPYMSSAMGPAVADMACVAAAMKAELARHAAVACTLSGVDADRAETAQHAATVTALAQHQYVRYEQMGDAMGMMTPTADSTWTCKVNADGTFTFGGQTWTPPQTPPTPSTTPAPTPNPTPYPWPMPCGGMMCPCDGSWGPGTSGSTDGGPPWMPGGMM
jgi:hypothetical protein